MYRMLNYCFPILLLAGLALPSALPAQVAIQIEGVGGAERQNVLANLTVARLAADPEVAAWRLRAVAGEAADEVRQALRPFGYYRADATLELVPPETEKPLERIVIRVQRGPPLTVESVTITINGPGTAHPEFAAWRKQWPLPAGAVLDQRRYEQAKRELEQAAAGLGYVTAGWVPGGTRITISRDLQHAAIDLTFDTGERAVFGRVSFADGYFSAAVMQRFKPITSGEPYDPGVLDRLRTDLAASLYFSDIAVIVEPDLSRSPPVVDVRVELERRPPNTYEISAGFGTDTGPRIELGWKRHYLSPRGDRLDLGLGAQQQDGEFVLRGEYRTPRGDDPGEYWFGRGLAQREDEDFRFERTGDGAEVFPRFDGEVRTLNLGGGLLSELWRTESWPVTQRLFLDFTTDDFDALQITGLDPAQAALLADNPDLIALLKSSRNVISAGASWNLRHIQGIGFAIRGTRAEVRLAGAAGDLGSDVSFAQMYAGVRHSRIYRGRHKVIVRGEVGYTAAKTDELTVTSGGRSLDLSITRIPERFRFKTGGDRTVRGFGFDALSNNRLGSNHLLTISSEYEYRVAEAWSVAGFFDAGNAFNDFGQRDLRKAVGIGARWYTLVGPVRLDLAHALDDPGDTVSLHLTIGSILL